MVNMQSLMYTILLLKHLRNSWPGNYLARQDRHLIQQKHHLIGQKRRSIEQSRPAQVQKRVAAVRWATTAKRRGRHGQPVLQWCLPLVSTTGVHHRCPTTGVPSQVSTTGVYHSPWFVH